MNKLVYLDNSASTRVRKEVVQAMLPYLREEYGNPSSLHALGANAQKAVNDARTSIARELGAKPWEIVFTSGGTESNNLALFGLARSALGLKKKKIIISALEHSSIVEVCQVLEREGFEIVRVGVNHEGLVAIEELVQLIDDRTLVVSIIHTHNELGIIQDVKTIGAICKKKGVLFHTDAVQSFGKVGIDVTKMNIDLLSASAHKIGGPKGTGILYVREGIMLQPLIYGGGQERGLRGGTENVAGIVGTSKALTLSRKTNWKKIETLRNYGLNELEKLGGTSNGSRTQRLSTHIHVSFPGIDAELLIAYLSSKGIMCSQKSACLSKQHKEDSSLTALGLDKAALTGSIRFVLSSETSKKDIDFLLKTLETFITRRR